LHEVGKSIEVHDDVMMVYIGSGGGGGFLFGALVAFRFNEKGNIITEAKKTRWLFYV